MELRRIAVGVVGIGMRADRDEHLFSVARKGDVPCPVPAACQTAPAGNVPNDGLSLTTRFQIAIAIGKPDNRIGIGYVNVLWIGSRGIERNAERLLEIGCKYAGLLRFP